MAVIIWLGVGPTNQKKLKVGRYYRGHCEIKIGKAFVYSNHGLPYRPMSGVLLVAKDVKLC